MRLSKAWIIAVRDFKIFRRVKYVWYSIVIFPVIISVLFPLVLEYGGRRSGGFSAAALPPLLNSFSFFLVIGAAVHSIRDCFLQYSRGESREEFGAASSNSPH